MNVRTRIRKSCKGLKLPRLFFSGSFLLLAVWYVGSIATAGTQVQGHKTDSGTEPFLVTKGRANAAIIIGKNGGMFSRWLAEEVQRYIRMVSYAELPIITSDNVPGDRPLIVLGGPAVNSLSATAQQRRLVDFNGLKPEGFVLKTVRHGNHPAVVVGGNEEAGTMYAAYDFLERLGIVFQITGDIIPRVKPDLALPVLDVREEPAFKHRGVHIDPGFATWYLGLEDYRKVIDQMAKLKFNRFEFYISIGSPWLEFSYKGQLAELTSTPESGFLAWGRDSRSWGRSPHSTTGTANDVKVGRDVFPQEYVGAPEFADVRTPEEAYRTAGDFLRQLIRYAHMRHIRVSLMTGELSFVPPNLAPPSAKVHREPVSAYQRYCGVALSPGNPLTLDIWETAMRSMIEAYPEADSFGFWTTEHSPDFRDPRVQEILDRHAEVRAKLPSVEEIRRRGNVIVDSAEQLDSDFLQMYLAAGLVHRIKKHHPNVRLGIMTLFRGYKLGVMDTMVPKDVWLGNMEQNGTTGPVMDFYAGINGRDLIAVPRITDDGDDFHMQLNATQYDEDEIIKGGAEYGLAGIDGQAMHLRNAEYNIRYLAEGTWDPQIRPRSFYEGYLSRIFGRDALDPLLKAFLLLEENEKAMVYWGRGSIFPNYRDFSPLAKLRTNVKYRDEKPAINRDELVQAINATWGMDPIWKGVHQAIASQHAAAVAGTEGQHYENRAAQCRKALDLLYEARPKVLPGSRGELEYVIYKTETLINYFDVLNLSYQAVVTLDRAWLARVDGDWIGFGLQLNRCKQLLDQADRLAKAGAGSMIAYADIPTERYLLLRFNRNVVTSIEDAREYLNEVITFHEGINQ